MVIGKPLSFDKIEANIREMVDEDRASRGLAPAVTVFRRAMTDLELLELSDRDTRRPMERLFATRIVGYTPGPVVTVLPAGTMEDETIVPMTRLAGRRTARRVAAKLPDEALAIEGPVGIP